MAVDVYQVCPCGSGKKLKFCCAKIIEEMERIERLIEDDQLRPAISSLESLHAKHPDNVWVLMLAGTALVEDGQFEPALHKFREVLKRNPEHDEASVAFPLTLLFRGDIETARKYIPRAFMRAAKKGLSGGASLAIVYSRVMNEMGQALAMRELLVLALKLADETMRQQIFLELLQFDSNSGIPYPLRGPHPLSTNFSGTEEQQTEFRKAMRFSAVGCWEMAADLFEQLAKAIDSNPDLWRNAGLCRAWDGKSEAAIPHFHRAAQLFTDPAVAVDCEVLAQYFTTLANLGQAGAEVVSLEGESQAIGRLLTALDAIPRLVRRPLDPNAPSEAENPAAVYSILDRDMPVIVDGPCEADQVPFEIGELQIWSSNSAEEPGQIFLRAYRGPHLNDSITLLATLDAGLMRWLPDGETSIRKTLPSYQYDLRQILPKKLRAGEITQINRQLERSHLVERWLDDPLASLGNRSPRAAASDKAAYVPLMAAAYLVHSITSSEESSLGLNDFLEPLGLAPLPTTVVPEDNSLNNLSVIQLFQIDVASLNDEGIKQALNRALLVFNHAFLKKVITLVVNHSQVMATIDKDKVYRGMIQLCLKESNSAEALEWVNRYRAALIESKELTFERQLMVDINELSVLAFDPQIEALRPFIQKLRQTYVAKLPQFEAFLTDILQTARLPELVAPTIALPGDSVSVTPSSVWSANQPTETASAGKLWLPGS
jgi:tetratricopeptide (TPR) repeat protein